MKDIEQLNIDGMPLAVGIKSIRDYFGEHDRSQFEHWAYSYLNKLLNVVMNDKRSAATTDAILTNPDNQIKIKPEGNTAQKEVGWENFKTEFFEQQMFAKTWVELWTWTKNYIEQNILAATHPDKDNSKAVDIDSLAEEILKKYKPDTRTAFDGSFAWAKEKVLAALKEMYLKGKGEDQWISVEDKQPDVIGILAYTGGLILKLTILEGIYYCPDGSRWCSDVTHWMPLPPPPTANDLTT